MTTCEICQGARWIRVEVPGRLVPEARPCDCHVAELEQRERERLVAESGLSQGMRRRFRFDTFQAETDELRYVQQRVLAYSEQPSDWLILLGPYGTGKTHLLVAATGRMLDDGRAVYYATVPNLLDDLRASMRAEVEDQRFERRWSRLERAEVLVLDDLGTESPTGWVYERLFTLLNARYQEALPTMIATNADPRAIGGRLGSRMLDTGLVEQVKINAPDYRQTR